MSLSRQQGEKIAAILKDQREETITVTGTYRNDPKRRSDMLLEIQRKSDNQIKKLLTEAQAALFEEIIRTRQEETILR